MHVGLIIFLALATLGAACYLHHLLTGRRTADSSGDPASPDNQPVESEKADAGECCGMHITCQRDSLLTAMADGAEYFDDEELDAYAGRAADSYTDTETEQFRDVLLTLRPDDIAPWARSIQLRGITLPTPVRDELLMIVAEERAARTQNSQS